MSDEIIVKNPYKNHDGFSICNDPYYKADRNHCTIVTFCVIFKCKYKKALDFIKNTTGRINKKGLQIWQLEALFSSVKKSKVVEGSYSSTNKISLGEFCKRHPVGRFYVVVRGHALAVVDGVIHDWTAKPKRQVIRVWRVYLEEKS